jgi:hypothetical protein
MDVISIGVRNVIPQTTLNGTILKDISVLGRIGCVLLEDLSGCIKRGAMASHI